MQESESIHKGNGGRKPKYDYTSEEFLSQVESYAKKGFTDKEIALALGLNQTYFYGLKGEIHEISDVLSRGRAQINATVRAKFLAMALGGIKTKNTIRRKIRNDDGSETGEEEIQVTEVELAPSLQAQTTWLYHHDEEWRKVERNQDENSSLERENGVDIEKWMEENESEN